jgi:hypothetical protein
LHAEAAAALIDACLLLGLTWRLFAFRRDGGLSEMARQGEREAGHTRAQRTIASGHFIDRIGQFVAFAVMIIDQS